jgi:hypothetical protein
VGTFVTALGTHKYAAYFLSRAGPRAEVNLVRAHCYSASVLTPEQEEDVRARSGRQGTTAQPAPPSFNCSQNSSACYDSYFPGVMLESLFVVLLIIVIASVGGTESLLSLSSCVGLTSAPQ